MSREAYDAECKGCRPAMLDPETMKPIPDTHPAMVAINAAWELAPESERAACHRVWCLNSRKGEDLRLMMDFVRRANAVAAPEGQA